MVTIVNSNTLGVDTGAELIHDTVTDATVLEAMATLLEYAKTLKTPKQLAEEALLENYVEHNDDLTAIEAVIPQWLPDQAYKVGAIVKDDGKIYVVIQDHTSGSHWLPESTASLYRIHNRTSEGAEIAEWVQPLGGHDAYQLGDKVLYNGDVWVSTYDGANSWAPGVLGWVKEIN